MDSSEVPLNWVALWNILHVLLQPCEVDASC
jgi:hypothetical protein